MIPRGIHIYSEKEIAGVRAACAASAQVLTRLCEVVQPGMTTLELDDLAGCFIRETGGTSGSYRYCGYPRQICISLNDEVVHGIGRADRVIQYGDLVKLDVVVNVDGYFGDNARTVGAGGAPGELAEALMTATRASLKAGIEHAREGNCVNDIGAAVENVVKNAGFSCVRDFVGHGCGLKMHEMPNVPNYRQNEKTSRLQAGMIICIEPMVNAGSWRVEVDAGDKWTVRTADHSLSAHFENQILITKKEPEILTVWPKNV